MNPNTPPSNRFGWLDDGGLTALAGLSIGLGLLYTNISGFLTARFGIAATPVHAIILAIGVVLATGVVRRQRLPQSTTAILLVLVGYISIIAVQVVTLGPPPGEILKLRVTWALVTAAAIVCFSNVNPRIFILIFRAAIVVSLAMLFLEYLTRFAPPFRMSTVIGRAAGFFMNPNIAALFLSAAIPIVTLGTPLARRIIWYSAIGAATLVTFSRGGMLLCVVLIALIELFPASREGHKSGRAILTIVLSSVAFYLLQDLVFDLLTHILSRYLDANTSNRLRFGGDQSSQLRLYVIQIALDSAKDSLLIGRGIGFANVWSVTMSVHNMFVLVLLEQGILGLLWFGTLFAALLSLRHPFGLWAASVYLVGGMFNHNLFDSPTYGMILAAYTALPAVTGLVPQVRARSLPRGNAAVAERI